MHSSFSPFTWRYVRGHLSYRMYYTYTKGREVLRHPSSFGLYPRDRVCFRSIVADQTLLALVATKEAPLVFIPWPAIVLFSLLYIRLALHRVINLFAIVSHSGLRRLTTFFFLFFFSPSRLLWYRVWYRSTAHRGRKKKREYVSFRHVATHCNGIHWRYNTRRDSIDTVILLCIRTARTR